MVLFSSSALGQRFLSFEKLSKCPQYLTLVATWAEDEWGYIRNKGINYRKEVLWAIRKQVYIATYHGKPVAMFALVDKEFDPRLMTAEIKLLRILELKYVYVLEDYRGLGFARCLINKAKQLARRAGAELIILDTLKPSLNSLYRKMKAEELCENQLYSQPTDVLAIKI